MRDKNHVILDVESCAEEVEEYYNLDDDGWEDEVTSRFVFVFFFCAFLSPLLTLHFRANGKKTKKALLQWGAALRWSTRTKSLAGAWLFLLKIHTVSVSIFAILS